MPGCRVYGYGIAVLPLPSPSGFQLSLEVGGGERRWVAGWPRAFPWLGTSTSATCFSLDCRKSMLGGRSLAQRVGDGIHLPSYQWLARLVPLSLNGSR